MPSGGARTSGAIAAPAHASNRASRFPCGGQSELGVHYVLGHWLAVAAPRLPMPASAARCTVLQPLDVADLDTPRIGAFLTHLECIRGNAVSSRNPRPAAVHLLFRFAALRHPEHAALIQWVLAIPPKRANQVEVEFFSPPEIDALVAAPDRSRYVGRRDHARLVVAVQTGLRI